MAVRFTRGASPPGTSSYLSVVAAPNYNAAYTGLLSYYPTTNTEPQDLMAIRSAAGTANFDVLFIPSAADDLFKFMQRVAGVDTTVATSLASVAGTWYDLAWVRYSATSVEVFGRAAGNAMVSITSGPQTVATVAGRTASGAVDVGTIFPGVGTNPVNGRIFRPGIYEGVALTLAEIDAYFARILPTRRANLWNWCPLLQAGDYIDYSGQGRGYTATGTPTTEDSPPISWGAPLPVQPQFASYQEVAPISTVAAGGWLNELGSAVNLHLSVDEETPSDADYIVSPTDPADVVAKLGLGDPGLPVAGDWKLRVRYKKI